MNLNQLVQIDPLDFDPKQFEGMDHMSLMTLRKMAEKTNPKLNEMLAPFEHQAFAREYVKDKPITGTLGVGAAIPLYALAKGIGFRNNGTATPPSVDQVVRGYRGIGQGLGLVK